MKCNSSSHRVEKNMSASWIALNLENKALLSKLFLKESNGSMALRRVSRFSKEQQGVSRCLHMARGPGEQGAAVSTMIRVKSFPWGSQRQNLTQIRMFTAGNGSQSARSSSSWGYILALSVAAGTGSYLIHERLNKQSNVEASRLHPFEEISPEDFEHPFKKRPIWFRMWIVTKRLLFLIVTFTPFAFITFQYLMDQSEKTRERWLNSLVSTFEAAGCSFQKFGQWMSMRPDMLPPDVIEAFSKLREDVPQHDMAHNETVIQESLGKSIDDVFEFFDPRPVASGTVAQVHRARLRAEMTQSGQAMDVAVKIRHPNVVDETFVDIDLIFAFVNTLGEVAGHLTIPFKKDEFHSVLQRQVDFRWEGYNLTKFGNNFKCLSYEEFADHDVSKEIFFPEVHHHLVSPSLLVESWAPGKTVAQYFSELGEGFVQISEGKGLRNPVFDKKVHTMKRELASLIYDGVMKMFLRDNYIHGDLHGGNILYSQQDGKVTILDAGVVVAIDPHWREKFHDFLFSLCTGNVRTLTQRLLEFNEAKEVDEKSFAQDIRATTEKWIGIGNRAPNGGPVMLGDFVGEILFKIQKHHLHLRGDVASTIVTMSLVEGLVKQLDPEFDVVGAAIPYFARYALAPATSFGMPSSPLEPEPHAFPLLD